MTMSAELTLARLRLDVAEVLEIPCDQLLEDQHLLEQGMDSIRLLSLVERWRARGAEVDFLALAEEPTLQRWSELLSGSVL
jgi:bifunctional isochorismate lyase/aryl carrier protein